MSQNISDVDKLLDMISQNLYDGIYASISPDILKKKYERTNELAIKNPQSLLGYDMSIPSLQTEESEDELNIYNIFVIEHSSNKVNEKEEYEQKFKQFSIIKENNYWKIDSIVEVPEGFYFE